jgi:hypothetical protein
MQAASAHPINSALVFLYLLETDAQRVGKFSLGHPHMHSACAHPVAKHDIEIGRAALAFRLLLACRHLFFPSSAISHLVQLAQHRAERELFDFEFQWKGFWHP